MARAAEQAYTAIRGAIAAGEVLPGSWLREEDVATRAGVSRTPVREALRRLHVEGVIEIVPNRGALVVGWTADDLDNLHDLRLLLEGYGARRAAEAAEGALDLRVLDALCGEMERIFDRGSDRARISELSVEFHTAIVVASGNRQLATIIPALIQSPLARQGYGQRTRAAIARSMAQHREILSALAAHDGQWAEAAMRAHVRSGRATLVDMSRPLVRGADQSKRADSMSRDRSEAR